MGGGESCTLYVIGVIELPGAAYGMRRGRGVIKTKSAVKNVACETSKTQMIGACGDEVCAAEAAGAHPSPCDLEGSGLS